MSDVLWWGEKLIILPSSSCFSRQLKPNTSTPSEGDMVLLWLSELSTLNHRMRSALSEGRGGAEQGKTELEQSCVWKENKEEDLWCGHKEEKWSWVLWVWFLAWRSTLRASSANTCRFLFSMHLLSVPCFMPCSCNGAVNHRWQVGSSGRASSPSRERRMMKEGVELLKAPQTSALNNRERNIVSVSVGWWFILLHSATLRSSAYLLSFTFLHQRGRCGFKHDIPAHLTCITSRGPRSACSIASEPNTETFQLSNKLQWYYWSQDMMSPWVKTFVVVNKIQGRDRTSINRKKQQNWPHWKLYNHLCLHLNLLTYYDAIENLTAVNDSTENFTIIKDSIESLTLNINSHLWFWEALLSVITLTKKKEKEKLHTHWWR